MLHELVDVARRLGSPGWRCTMFMATRWAPRGKPAPASERACRRPAAKPRAGRSAPVALPKRKNWFLACGSALGDCMKRLCNMSLTGFSVRRGVVEQARLQRTHLLRVGDRPLEAGLLRSGD